MSGVLTTALRVGDAAPAREWVVTQEIIDRYADATGDHNPIHVDPDYSATGPFGRTIAHGLMTLAYVGQVLNRWTDGAFDREGAIEVSFTGPVFVGDTVRISAEVVEIDPDGTAVCDLHCTAGDRRILVGTARLPTTKETPHGT